MVMGTLILKIINFYKTKKKFFSFLLLIIIILILGYYIYLNRDSLNVLKSLTLINVFIIFLFHVLTIALLGVINFFIIKKLCPKIKFMDVIFLQFINNSFNNVISKSGTAYRAIFLKNKYRLSFSNYISSLTGFFIFNFLINSFFGSISLLIIYFRYGVFDLLIQFSFISIFLITTTFLLVNFDNLFFINNENKFFKYILNIKKGWDEVKKDNSNLVIIFILASAILVIKTLQLQYVYEILKLNPNILEMAYLSSTSILMQIINITPGAIGLREGLFAYSSSVVGIEKDLLIIGSLLLRTGQFLSTISLGTFSYFYLNRDFQEIEISEEINIENHD